MDRIVVLPAWLSALSLAVALFVPLGVSLISDTAADSGNRKGVTHGGSGRLTPVEGYRIGGFDHRA